VSDDEARVQDIVTTLAFLKSSKENTESSEIYASGDASLWATFAAAIVPWHVDLHLEDTPKLFNDADYLAHFNVPGIERAGGLLMATQLTGAN
jgi:hypothetical protein